LTRNLRNDEIKTQIQSIKRKEIYWKRQKSTVAQYYNLCPINCSTKAYIGPYKGR